jgi:hypothetical protein
VVPDEPHVVPCVFEILRVLCVAIERPWKVRRAWLVEEGGAEPIIDGVPDSEYFISADVV